MDENHNVETMASAFRQVLSEGAASDEGSRAILIKRIPIICNDILTMKSDLRWIRWLVVGIAGGIGILALKALGA